MINKQTLLSFSIVVFCSVSAVAQNNTLSVLQSKLEKYNTKFPTERLYVHTDKNFYTAGEILWFKVYNWTDSVNKAAIASKIVYVEILDDHNTPVLQAKIAMDKNSGDGSLELPLTLNSGYYHFRAYTNWMKNFGADHFFEKKITVVNPFKTIPAAVTTPTSSLDLFPEGGNLVNGILSQIGFKISRNNAEVSGKGYVIDENNDTAARFAPFKFGLGSFYFTPDVQHRYKALYIFDDNTFITRPLPEVFSNGYVMHLDEENNKLSVTVRANNSSSSELFLIAQNHQTIKTAKQNAVVNGIAIFSINKTDLGPGISQLTVFDGAKQPVCERLFFMRPSQETVIKTNLAKNNYTNREKVEVSITPGSSTLSNLSVSVFQLDSLQENTGHDISSYIWLESELSDKIENPRYYLSGQSEEVKKASDHLMLTYGWRRFDWNSLLNQSPVIKFSPDNEGQTIVCKVTDAATGAPVKDAKIFLSIPETAYKLFPGISNDSGIVRIRVNEYYGKGEIILQPVERNDNFKIEVIKPFADHFTNSSDGLFFNLPKYKNGIGKL